MCDADVDRADAVALEDHPVAAHADLPAVGPPTQYTQTAGGATADALYENLAARPERDERVRPDPVDRYRRRGMRERGERAPLRIVHEDRVQVLFRISPDRGNQLSIRR